MEIKEYLSQNIKHGKKYAIMGIGSVLRSDDGAGMYFIELCEQKLKRDDLLLIGGSTAPENFTGVIKDFRPEKLFIIDAAHMGMMPGEYKILNESDIGGLPFTTHMLPLSVIVKYLEAEANCQAVFIGIQPLSTDLGFEMCNKVADGTKKLAQCFFEVFT